MVLFDRIRQVLREGRDRFLKLDVPQKTAVVSLALFVVCSVVASTTLTFVLLGAGVVGFWAACKLLSRSTFCEREFVGQYLPTLVDPRKPGGKKVAAHYDAIEPAITQIISPTPISQAQVQQDLKGKRTSLNLSITYNLQILIDYILEDFVLSWYNISVSQHDSVSDQIEHHLFQLTKDGLPRLRKVSPISLLCVILELFRLHVHRYRRARTSLRRIARGRKVDSSSLVASYETFALLHPAVQSETTELDYLRRCMDILQHVLFPKEIVKCQAANVLLNEILSVNVLQSLVDLIADPDTVNEIIVLIVSNEEKLSPNSTEKSQKKESTEKRQKRHSKGSTARPIQEKRVITEVTHDHESQFDNEHVDPGVQVPGNQVTDLNLPCGANNDGIYQQEMRDKDRQPVKGKGQHVDILDGNLTTGVKKRPGIKYRASTQEENNAGDIIDKVSVPQNSSEQRSHVLLQKLGIQSSKHESHNESRPNDLTSDIDSDQEIPNVLPQGSPKKTEMSSSSPQSRNSAFAFPIPFTAIGPSLPIFKQAQPPLEGSRTESEHEGQQSDVFEHVDSLRFATVPLTAIGPSFPVRPNTPGSDTATSESGESRSRSSSSSSFASVTYEDDQQDIPFEELDFQFAYGKEVNDEESKVKSEQKERKMLPSSLETKPSNLLLEESRFKSEKLIDRRVSWQGEQQSSKNSESCKAKERQKLQSSLDTHSLLSSDKSRFKSEDPIDRRASWQGEQSSKNLKFEIGKIGTHEPAPHHAKKDLANLKVIATPEEERLLATVPTIPKQLHSPPSSAGPYSKDKDMTFQPISSGAALAVPNSPTKGKKHTLTRSQTMPSLKAIPKQEVARSEVRILEAKLGRFLISSVDIPSWEVTKDLSGKEYVLYCVEYEVIAQGNIRSSDSNTTESTAPSDVVKKSVKRRFREFVNLHCRLEDNVRLRQFVRSIKEPPARLTVGLAFGVTKTEHRKVSLQRYLEQLIREPMLGHSEEIAEFLALGGDAHIEFVKKRTDIAPRIDQFLQWAVPSFVGTLKTAIPRAVTDLGTGPTLQALSPPVSPKSHRRHKGRDGGALMGRDGVRSPTHMDNLDMDWVHQHFQVESRKATRIQSAAHVFLQDQQDNDSSLPTQYKTSQEDDQSDHKPPHNLGPRFQGDGCDSDEPTQDDTSEKSKTLPMEEIELLDKIMALLSEASYVHGESSWILDERFQKGVCVVLGKPLDKWISTQIESLVSEPWCGYYLTLIRDAIWPNGELIQGKVTRTEAEKCAMKEEALQCLVDILPSNLRMLIGEDKVNTGMEVMLDSLQDPQLNRHLVFTLLDLLVEAIANEVNDPQFQDALLTQ